MGKMRGRDKTFGLEDSGVEKRRECSNNVTSVETKC